MTMSGQPFVKLALALALVFLFMNPAEAFFRHLCFNPLGFGRIDPVVFPNQLSTHLHHLHGSGNLGINSVDADYLLSANCTSCSITLDKSGYWAPAMYFQHDNGTLELLTTAGSLTIYYKTERRVNFLDQNYTAFPKGFRMVAGDPNKRTWVGPWPIPKQSFWGPNDTTQEALASKALGFNCMNYNAGAEATFAYSFIRNKAFTDAQCIHGIRAEILFPSCWDGVNLDSPDHKSHVVYPDLLQDGSCPKTHPVFLPILFFETIWNTQQFAGVPGKYVLSNGDPTGYGYHADFLAAWVDGAFERAMADPMCTDQNILDRHNTGIQEDCPVFHGFVQSQEEAARCLLKTPPSLIHEKVLGQLDVLPGNIKVTGVRHDPGTNPDDNAAPSVPVAPSAPAASSIPAAPSVPAVPSVPAAPVNASSYVAAPPSSAAPVVTSSSSPLPSAPVTSVTVHAPGVTTITSIYTSNGIKYEVVEIVYVVTVTSVVTQPKATTTATVSRRHVHGGMHHDGA